jgi:circadian clock protein KaiC
MRAAQEAWERAAAVTRRQELERKQRELERKRKALGAQIEAMRAEFEAVEEEARLLVSQDQEREDVLTQDKTDMAHRRGGDAPNSRPRPKRGKTTEDRLS